MSMKRGYSLVVLVIAIAVILILSSVSITMLKTSRETIESSDFIYDITTIEEMLKQYHAESGTLPVISNEPINIPDEIKSQLDLLDNENYYDLDLGKIGNVSIVDRDRGYILNEQTLRVYCRQPLNYAGKNYYTITPELMGREGDYENQEEEITVAGNPLVWSKNARMRVIIPRKALELKEEGETAEEFWSDWSFSWDFGPKSIEKLKESATAKEFSYGDTLVVKTNGVYTIYVKDPSNNETLLNVVVTKVDDIKPTCVINGSKIDIIDNETGIKNIYYKTSKEFEENRKYIENIEEDEEIIRDELDFFLLGGKGNNLMEDMPLIIQNYNARYSELIENREVEENRYSNLTPEEQIENFEEHDRIMQEIEDAEASLKREYPYLIDRDAIEEIDIGIGTPIRNGGLVLYIEDQAGNAIVVGDEEVISFNMVAEKYDLGKIVVDEP